MVMSVEGYTAFYCQDVKWLIKNDLPIPLKERLISDLSSSRFFEQNVPIKKGKRKSIWIFNLPSDQEDEAYIIKRYVSGNFLARFKNLITSSKAIRELKAAATIDRKGIPTTTPIAIGEKGKWGLVKEGYVVLKRLKECQDLNSYFLKEYPARKPSQNLLEKWIIIKEFGMLARKIHQEGILQSDFALNNFLLIRDTTGGVKLYLTDFEKITIKRTLSFNQKVRCLAKLNRVGREISAMDRLRFLKSYLAGDDNIQQVLSLVKIIQERTIDLLKQDTARGRITSVYTDALYDKYEQKEIRGYYRKGYKIEEILDTIQRFDLLAKSLPSSDVKQREEISMELTCDGNVQPLKVVRYLYHPKIISASKLWIKMSTLALAGIPLDIPHAFMEMKVKGNQEDYLFLPMREDEVPLGEFLKPSLNKKELLFLTDLLLKLMKKLHCFGTFSGRISEDDFTILEKEGGKPSIHMKNVERFDIKKEVSLIEKKRELAVVNALIKKHYPMLTFDLTQRYFKEAKTS
jgi:tRNA A-37 threonylcarbamoyl transferase component Bud32